MASDNDDKVNSKTHFKQKKNHHDKIILINQVGEYYTERQLPEQVLSQLG
jgi:demethoxyubiquinone hydroxylase (CLK1/Coq7/Cat5 family)